MRFHCEDCPGRLNRSRLSRFLNFYFLQQKAVTEAGPQREKAKRGAGMEYGGSELIGKMPRVWNVETDVPIVRL